jgi:hypothetical protein
MKSMGLAAQLAQMLEPSAASEGITVRNIAQTTAPAGRKVMAPATASPFGKPSGGPS